jgi:hypothetical protein
LSIALFVSAKSVTVWFRSDIGDDEHPADDVALHAPAAAAEYVTPSITSPLTGAAAEDPSTNPHPCVVPLDANPDTS